MEKDFPPREVNQAMILRLLNHAEGPMDEDLKGTLWLVLNVEAWKKAYKELALEHVQQISLDPE